MLRCKKSTILSVEDELDEERGIVVEGKEPAAVTGPRLTSRIDRVELSKTTGTLSLTLPTPPNTPISGFRGQRSRPDDVGSYVHVRAASANIHGT